MPFLVFVLIVFVAGIVSGIQTMMRSLAQSSGYAEQALQAIKVVQAFG